MGFKVKILKVGRYGDQDLKAHDCEPGDVLEVRGWYGLMLVSEGWAERLDEVSPQPPLEDAKDSLDEPLVKPEVLTKPPEEQEAISPEEEAGLEVLMAIPGVGPKVAAGLWEAGYRTVMDIVNAGADGLADNTADLGWGKAESIWQEACKIENVDYQE